MPTVGMICEYLDRFAQTQHAADWDNVGLLLGDTATEVQRVMTCLTITPEVVQEALQTGVQLLVTHHPILFKGIKSFTTQQSEGKLLWPLARAGIAVYSPHTGFDNTRNGINDWLAEQIGLQQVQPLRPWLEDAKYKIVVFVPENDLNKVADAMFQVGAGIIGQYSQCSFRIPGTGTFFGSDETNPTVGQKGRREEVAEWRLEVVCPERSINAVLQAMRQSHSYEEPAFDVYPLKEQPTKTGEGRIGKLAQPMPVSALASTVRHKLRSGPIQVVGSLDRSVQTVALACGAAGEFLSDAIRQKADLFLTGEMRFHDYLRAQASKIVLLLPGHYATERPAVEQLANHLQTIYQGLKIWPSKQETDPVTWI